MSTVLWRMHGVGSRVARPRGIRGQVATCLLVCFACLAAPLTAHAAAAGDSLYNANHPRLLFSVADIPALQAKVADGGEDDAAYAYLRYGADNLFPPLSAAAILGNDFGFTSIPLLGITKYLASLPDSASNAMGRTITLYLADNYAVDFDEANSAGRLQSLAFGYDMFFDDAPDSLRDIVRGEIESYLNLMGHHFNYLVWQYRPYLANHSAMVAGALGLGAICLQGESDPQLLSDAMDRADTIVDSLFTFQIDPGGSYKEGALYFGWTMRYLIYYFHARRAWDGTDFSTHPKVRAFEQWVPYEILPEGNGRLNNINDSTYWGVPLSYHHTYFDWAQSMWGSRLSAWIWEHVAGTYGVDTGLSGDKVATVLWHQNLVPQQPDSVLSRTQLWEDRGLYYYRSGWQSGANSDDVVFSFFSGKYHGGHAQSDHNNFTLYGYGAQFAIDHGPGFQSAKTKAHNLVLIDGQGQHFAGNSIGTDGRISAYLQSGFADYLQGDATSAYTTYSEFNRPNYPFPGVDWSWGYMGANPVDFARRDVVVIHDSATPPYFIIMDDIDKDGSPHDYEWRLHTAEANVVDTTGVPIRILAGTSFLDIHAADPWAPVTSVAIAPYDNGMPEPDATLITFTRNAINPRFAFILVPGDGAVTEPVVQRTDHSWGAASWIDWGGGTVDCFIFNPAGGAIAINTRTKADGRSRYDRFDRPLGSGGASGDAVGGASGHREPHSQAGTLPGPGAEPVFLATDATFALVRFQDGGIDRYLASRVSTLVHDHRTYIAIDDGPINCAHAGGRVDIDRADAGFVFYAPSVTQVMFRNQPVAFQTINGFVMSPPDSVAAVSPLPASVPFVTSVAPNPFNPVTRLSLKMLRTAHVRVAVYDVQGRLVDELMNRQLGAGHHSIEWRATTSRHQRAASGVYFLRVEAAGHVRTHKIVVIK